MLRLHFLLTRRLASCLPTLVFSVAAAVVMQSCARPPSGEALAPTSVPRTVATSPAPEPSPVRDPAGSDGLSLSDRDSIEIHELAAYLAYARGPAWREHLTRFLAAPYSEEMGSREQYDAFRRLLEGLVDENRTQRGSPTALHQPVHDRYRTKFRTQVIEVMEARQREQIIALAVSSTYRPSGGGRRDPLPPWSGDDDTCDQYNTCVGAHQTDCEDHADEFLETVKLAMATACIAIGALAASYTLAGALLGVGCYYFTNALGRYLTKWKIEDCLMTYCGTSPRSCI